MVNLDRIRSVLRKMYWRMQLRKYRSGHEHASSSYKMTSVQRQTSMTQNRPSNILVESPTAMESLFDDPFEDTGEEENHQTARALSHDERYQGDSIRYEATQADYIQQMRQSSRIGIEDDGNESEGY